VLAIHCGPESRAIKISFLSPTWSPHPDLNRGPLPYQGSALPLSYVGVVSPSLAQPSLMERVMGIEPTSSAWKAEVLPLNYTRLLFLLPALTSLFKARKNSDSLDSQTVRMSVSYNVCLSYRDTRSRISPGFLHTVDVTVNACLPGKPCHQDILLYSSDKCRHLPPSDAKSGGGGRIRTYVGIASRFTVCPR
jgi:hypothetical protein